MRRQCTALALRALRRPQCRPLNTPISTGVARHLADSRPDRPPLDGHGHYADRLDQPLHSVQPATRTPPEPPPAEELPKTEQEERLAKARVVFGSRLAGPVERREQLDRASQLVAGILVPPRPDEPDNCCMSGCVNCVWDRYRDELEEWAMKSAEARQKVTDQRVRGQATGLMARDAAMPSHVATSMDDDGGGSESNWAGDESPGQGNVDLFDGVPVGIREFMKTEKRLRELRRRDRAAVL